MRIAFLGNHNPEFSTEREYDWTFEQLGHQVIRLQEGQATGADCIAAGVTSDLFCYVHTHEWETPGSIGMEEVLSIFRARGVKTFGMHLDRYVGLNIGDQREEKVGQHPWWKCQFIFTADGGNAEFFKVRNVNHFWLPPAIAKRHCFVGTPRDEYKCDIAWVGAKGYHPEYPFRERLVTWLETTAAARWNVKIWGHGPRGGVRGSALNDIYASAKIVVGDSCFAGAPYYWSDRIPETLGRRGFLLHPFSAGMTNPWLMNYDANNLMSLGERIEYWLPRDKERDEIQKKCMEWVSYYDTYHNRVAEMFKVMGLA